jgi:hypothetical protein
MLLTSQSVFFWIVIPHSSLRKTDNIYVELFLRVQQHHYLTAKNLLFWNIFTRESPGLGERGKMVIFVSVQNIIIIYHSRTYLFRSLSFLHMPSFSSLISQKNIQFLPDFSQESGGPFIFYSRLSPESKKTSLLP